MMRLIVVQRGRLRDAHVLALRDEFAKRIGRYAKLDLIEHERGAWPAAARWKVLLDERGDALSSSHLAERLARWTALHGTVAFAIGGADGHHADTIAAADARWALGPATLPHHLAHLIVVEQLYRAATIIAGHPYHHA